MGCLRRFPALQGHLHSVYSTITTPIHDWVISPMTSIAKIIYHSQPANHFYQGLTQIRHLPQFFNSEHVSEHTRQLVKQISITNGIKYLAPVIIYRTLVNDIALGLPDSMKNTVNILDWLMLTTILTRLLIRRGIDNTIYSSILKKTVNKDLAKHIATVFSKEFSPIFAKIFLPSGDLEAFYQPLISRLEPLFLDLLAKKNISEKHFSIFQKNLSALFLQTLNELEVSKVLFKHYPAFCDLLAKTITQKLANITLKIPLEINTIEFERTFYPLTIFHKERIKETFQALENLARIKNQLPIKSAIEDCGCETKKIVHGNLSGPLYFNGNILLTYWPEAAEFFGLRAPIFEIGKMFGYVLRAMFYAQSFMETRLDGKELCTSHRYEELAKNKAYLLGFGSSYVIVMEIVAGMLKKLTGIDNILVRDAMGSFLIHLFNINILAYKEPLPGTQKYPWDPFVPFRKITFYTATGLQTWLIRESNDPEAKKDSIDKIKKALGSYPAYDK